MRRALKRVFGRRAATGSASGRDRDFPVFLPNCIEGAHGDCAHVFTALGAPEGEHGLCSCKCHASCLLTGASSVSDAEWRSSCTCAGAEKLWRNQEQLGLGPADVARLMEEARQRMAPPDGLVQGYRVAAAQAGGRPLPGQPAMEDPRRAMNFFVDFLARRESDEEATRLLGLTDAQVTAARDAWQEVVIATRLDHIKVSGRRRRKIAKQMAAGMERSR